jgi:multisubunit Na+/H+ antiporter MnhB subunit
VSGGRRASVALGLALAVPPAALLATAAATIRDAQGLRDLVVARLGDSGASNPVTAVLLDFRSYDTLLEVAVLLAAALAVLALQPGDDLDALPLPPPAEPVLQTLVRVVVPASVVVSGWLLLIGTSRPGGAFQAGALLAGVLVLLRSTGHRSPAPGRRSLRGLLVAGTAAFLGLAVATALVGDGLLVLDPSWAGLAVLVVETALAVSIAVTLAELYVADQPPPLPPAGARR